MRVARQSSLFILLLICVSIPTCQAATFEVFTSTKSHRWPHPVPVRPESSCCIKYLTILIASVSSWQTKSPNESYDSISPSEDIALLVSELKERYNWITYHVHCHVALHKRPRALEWYTTCLDNISLSIIRAVYPLLFYVKYAQFQNYITTIESTLPAQISPHLISQSSSNPYHLKHQNIHILPPNPQTLPSIAQSTTTTTTTNILIRCVGTVAQLVTCGYCQAQTYTNKSCLKCGMIVSACSLLPCTEAVRPGDVCGRCGSLN